MFQQRIRRIYLLLRLPVGIEPRLEVLQKIDARLGAAGNHKLLHGRRRGPERRNRHVAARTVLDQIGIAIEEHGREVGPLQDFCGNVGSAGHRQPGFHALQDQLVDQFDDPENSPVEPQFVQDEDDRGHVLRVLRSQYGRFGAAAAMRCTADGPLQSEATRPYTARNARLGCTSMGRNLARFREKPGAAQPKGAIPRRPTTRHRRHLKPVADGAQRVGCLKLADVPVELQPIVCGES